MVKWQFQIGDGWYSPAIAADGTIYAIGGYTLRAFSPNGTSLWSYPLGGYWGTPVIGRDGTIYLTMLAGDFPWGYFVLLRALTPEGVLKWEFKPSGLGQQYFPGSAAIDRVDSN